MIENSFQVNKGEKLKVIVVFVVVAVVVYEI
jgi:hypothetical protein